MSVAITRLAQLLNTEPKPLLVIDPFAGVGGVHTLAGYGIGSAGKCGLEPLPR
jgi:hypothetical protein